MGLELELGIWPCNFCTEPYGFFHYESMIWPANSFQTIAGASSGIGAETARVLALRGVHVIMGVRNTAAGQEVKETIIKEIPVAKVDVMELDLSSMASVEKFASDFISSARPLNILM